MHATTGDFANGIEPRQRGGGIEIGGNAPHPVVRGWGHRKRHSHGVQPQLAAAPQDRGELFDQLGFAHRAEIQPQLRQLLLLHGANHGAAELIAGQQFTATGEKRCSIGLHQACPFAP